MAKSSSPKPVEELTYEEAFAELETIVNTLEGEQNQLEEAMSLFERGQALAKVMRWSNSKPRNRR
jgi:exodeoxyribonuclease VII small subunit